MVENESAPPRLQTHNPSEADVETTTLVGHTRRFAAGDHPARSYHGTPSTGRGYRAPNSPSLQPGQ